MEELRYPIGKFDNEKIIYLNDLPNLMQQISTFPDKLSEVVIPLNEKQINTPYRPGGWTVKQVIHHLADSHMHAHLRFLLALTENQPTIKPYKEDACAELAYINHMPISISLDVIKSVHHRWFFLLQSMTPIDFDRTYMHPQYQKVYSLRQALGSYVWHGKHHLAHITQLIKRNFDLL
jgi:hypothetical protein